MHLANVVRRGKREDGTMASSGLCSNNAGAQFNWILKTLLNVLLRFLLSFTGCPTVLQNSIEVNRLFNRVFNIQLN